MSSKFKLEGDLVGRLDEFGPNAKRAMVAAANYVRPEAEDYMKTQAPWTDRTGNARQGLKANVSVSKDKVAIILSHSVPYGPFLEVRWGGRFGIIRNTMAAMGPRFVEVVGKLMFK